MSQMNPEEFVDNTAYSVQLPYIAGLSLQGKKAIFENWGRISRNGASASISDLADMLLDLLKIVFNV